MVRTLENVVVSMTVQYERSHSATAQSSAALAVVLISPEPGLCWAVLDDVWEDEVDDTRWSELMLSWPWLEPDFLGFLSVRCSGELFLAADGGRRGLSVALTVSHAWALYSTISP